MKSSVRFFVTGAVGLGPQGRSGLVSIAPQRPEDNGKNPLAEGVAVNSDELPDGFLITPAHAIELAGFLIGAAHAAVGDLIVLHMLDPKDSLPEDELIAMLVSIGAARKVVEDAEGVH